MKKTILILLTIAIFAACTKDPVSNNIDSTQYYLKCIKQYNGAGNYSSDSLGYDANNRLIFEKSIDISFNASNNSTTMDSASSYYSYVGNSNVPISSKSYGWKYFYTQVFVDTSYYFYDAQNRVTKISDKNNINSLDNSTIIYNSNGYYINVYGNGSIYHTDTVTFSNNNIAKIVRNDYLGPLVTTVYPSSLYSSDISAAYNPNIANTIGASLVNLISYSAIVNKNAYNFSSMASGAVVTKDGLGRIVKVVIPSLVTIEYSYY